MKKLSIFLAITVYSMLTLAQQNSFVYRGQITDPSGTGLTNAVVINVKDTLERTLTDKNGLFTLFTRLQTDELLARFPGHTSIHQMATVGQFVHITMVPKPEKTAVVVPVVEVQPLAQDLVLCESIQQTPRMHKFISRASAVPYPNEPVYSSESYATVQENGFHQVKLEPLSTFSADVDRASYANVRRFLQLGQLPPVDAVRSEEMINYFEYDYRNPVGNDPVAIYTSVSQAPWNADHLLMQIGIKAKDMDKEDLPPSNLTFLIDVSGSMGQANKLPLLKSAMKMLVDEMRDEDHVAIVVYAGAAGLVLKPTSGAHKNKIKQAIDQLESGGSTAGGAGIQLAYQVASEQFDRKGNNRVILATDGDFNVGASSDGAMEQLIEEKRQTGVFLTVLGFGMGNYKDSKMEILADKGNGNYAYIDNLMEAKKTLVSEFGGTMFTLAKDVKLQVEFNPELIAEYRLIGYENRALNNEDFNDDTKDAGEMGVGHVVTALYELVPVGVERKGSIDPLKYQGESEHQTLTHLSFPDELANVKVRYKEPDGAESKLIAQAVKVDDAEFSKASENLRWSASVAAFSMLLRQSEFTGKMSYEEVIKWAKSAIGDDPEGYRRECVQLMQSAESITRNTASK